jgi:hypothetical protein
MMFKRTFLSNRLYGVLFVFAVAACNVGVKAENAGIEDPSLAALPKCEFDGNPNMQYFGLPWTVAPDSCEFDQTQPEIIDPAKRGRSSEAARTWFMAADGLEVTAFRGYRFLSRAMEWRTLADGQEVKVIEYRFFRDPSVHLKEYDSLEALGNPKPPDSRTCLTAYPPRHRGLTVLLECRDGFPPKDGEHWMPDERKAFSTGG